MRSLKICHPVKIAQEDRAVIGLRSDAFVLQLACKPAVAAVNRSADTSQVRNAIVRSAAADVVNSHVRGYVSIVGRPYRMRG